MRRLFYAGTLAEEITITGGDAHHLARVMRAQIGDEVTVADTDGSFLDSPFMPAASGHPMNWPDRRLLTPNDRLE